MLKFVPPLTSESSYTSEYKIFKLLSESSLEGYVFHSLLLPDHQDKVVGEIDFVLLTEHGLLCLEVKGGDVLFESGKWIKIDKYDNNYIGGEGPFKQVLGNMFSFIQKAKRTFPARHALFETVIGCGVMFPDIYFNNYGMEVDKRWIYDQSFVHQSIDTYLLNLYTCWKSRNELLGRKANKLTSSQIEGVHKMLRSDFFYKVKLPAVINLIDGQQVLLTQEQFTIYESLFDNPRVIVEGGAGTGKTMLAVELFKREHERKRKVLFLTFNKLLAKSLKNSYDQTEQGSVITCIHDYYMACTGFTEPNDVTNVRDFFDSVLPDAYAQLPETEKTKFDVLIVDEAQDILDTVNLMNIEEMVEGGFSKGSWYLFFDSNQNLYNEDFEMGLELIRSYSPLTFSLVKNCRNTHQIANYIKETTSIVTGKVFPINGEEVERIEVNNEVQLLSEVQRIVKDLKKDGVNLSDVVILSSHRFENSVLSKVSKDPFKSICRFMVTKADSWFLAPNDTLRYITAYAFKGLEASIVIMLDFQESDLNSFKGEAHSNMLRYTAISRAKVKLFEVMVV